jgi:hypothetical protein
MHQHQPSQRIAHLLHQANAQRVQDALKPKPFPIY